MLRLRTPRPIKPSRRKWQESVKLLKSVIRHDQLSFVMRMRAVEILCAIYGVDLAEVAGKRTRKVVKDLVEEHAFEQRLRLDLEAKVRNRVISDAEAAARAFLGETEGQQATATVTTTAPEQDEEQDGEEDDAEHD